MNAEQTILNIDGMTCNHCVMNVKKAITSVDGVSEVEVFLNENRALINGTFSFEKVKKAIEDIGYKVV